MSPNDTPSQNKFLKAKIRIGSCKGPVSYNAKINVFHHDDIPHKARERALEVKEWARSKLLDENNMKWNNGTDLNIPLCERRSMENFIRDRSKPYVYNYRSESLESLKSNEVIDKPTKFHISRQNEIKLNEILNDRKTNLISRGQYKRMEEAPINSNLVNSRQWNSSSVLTMKEYKESLDQFTNKARASTAKSNSRYLNEYLSPTNQTSHLQDLIRNQKTEGTFNRMKGVTLKEKEEIISSKDQFINRQAVEKSKKYKTDKHSGLWEYNKIEKKYMWSDTASFDINSKGDTITVHNPVSYNLEGPTTNRPVSSQQDLWLVGFKHVK